MANKNPSDILDQEGPAAPPRTNGELVFELPWESRVFGLTMSLYEAGQFDAGALYQVGGRPSTDQG